MNPCAVCGNALQGDVFTVREMMYGTGDEFTYVECGNCKTIQLVDPPADLARHYPEGYYAYAKPARLPSNPAIRVLHRFAGSYLDNGLNPAGWLYFRVKPSSFEQWIRITGTRRSDKILDFGCGNGNKLAALASMGFTRLWGVEPYLGQDEVRIGAATIRKGTLESLQGEFNLVMMHHSFEHMPDPARVMHKLTEHMKPGGWMLLRLPVGDCHAWREYRENWFRLDAPRHFFIHTEAGIKLLAKAAGLSVERVIYDSSESQFVVSELYRRGISMMERRGKPLTNYFSRRQLNTYRRKAKQLNKQHDGDAAAFYLRKL